MGPAGTGKTTIGSAVASRLGWTFIEGDSFHPRSNIDKMAAGTPLTDEDREPWLAVLAERLRVAARANESVVLACSALKESYRSRLKIHDGIRFVFLSVPPQVLHERMLNRKGHFVPASLLTSQLETLEVPRDAVAVDATRPVSDTVDEIVSKVAR